MSHDNYFINQHNHTTEGDGTRMTRIFMINYDNKNRISDLNYLNMKSKNQRNHLNQENHSSDDVNADTAAC